ncbi:MAG: hypothetical protein ONB48_10990 [candidate division KSB1 bacterium]|nr:hypothetical protein [candidate division KSB1 bacterium]MDZ7275520.1 hypothetical protein [candidate division KSB1 bacterium]MDZ7286168.1 hypothetical protein [candidate division KSB1 bacterium]MDZ7296394.1 hypothetical protein [candidate division KSB1 bacterium]MDZ7306229.1 hypothetical protein [candidate division KSB1 bacterium]
MTRLQIPLGQVGTKMAAGKNADLAPLASMAVEKNGTEVRIALELQGVISDASAQHLADFLSLAGGLGATRWTLQMQKLVVLSRRGLQSLMRFARLLARRGSKLEIIGISDSVLATLRDLHSVRAFGWAD